MRHPRATHMVLVSVLIIASAIADAFRGYQGQDQVFQREAEPENMWHRRQALEKRAERWSPYTQEHLEEQHQRGDMTHELQRRISQCQACYLRPHHAAVQAREVAANSQEAMDTSPVDSQKSNPVDDNQAKESKEQHQGTSFDTQGKKGQEGKLVGHVHITGGEDAAKKTAMNGKMNHRIKQVGKRTTNIHHLRMTNTLIELLKHQAPIYANDGDHKTGARYHALLRREQERAQLLKARLTKKSK